MHVMLDLETLGVRPDACIIQIGAVLFEPVSGGKLLNGKGFRQNVLVQDGAGTIDHGTVAWWLQQATAAQMGKLMSEHAVPLSEALDAFVRWPTEVHDLSWEAIGGVWSLGASFDQPIMQSAFARFGTDVPWHYRASRCCRTLFALTGGVPDVDWTGLTPHDALDDAIGQAMQVQKAMRR